MSLNNFNITLDKSDSFIDIDVSSEDNSLSLTNHDDSNNNQTIPMTYDVIIKKVYSPFIGASGTWFEYDNKRNVFYDTGIIARGGSQVTFYNRFEFPNIGRSNTLYIAKDEHKCYVFDEENLVYRCVGSDYSEVKVIKCGLD